MIAGWLASKNRSGNGKLTTTWTWEVRAHGWAKVEQCRSTVHHASSPTTRTEAALLTAERNQFLVMTGFTPNAWYDRTFQ